MVRGRQARHLRPLGPVLGPGLGAAPSKVEFTRPDVASPTTPTPSGISEHALDRGQPDATASRSRPTARTIAYERFGANPARRCRAAGMPAAGPISSPRRARATSCPAPSTTTASSCGRARTRNPHRAGWQMERDVDRRSGGGSARARHAPRAVLLRRPRLDLRRPADRQHAGAHRAIPQTDDYARYADAHWRELIERYRPDVLWNDIGYPQKADFNQLFADYYNAIPEGVVNNRFDVIGAQQGTAHHDFFTPEYDTSKEIKAKKWEACRGIGNSFGYNRNEDESRPTSRARGLVHLLADIVSKNGNLLLNVGPTAIGEIPWPQADSVCSRSAPGSRTNGEAIYGTRPWHVADAVSSGRPPGALHGEGRRALRDRPRPRGRTDRHDSRRSRTARQYICSATQLTRVRTHSGRAPYRVTARARNISRHRAEAGVGVAPGIPVCVRDDTQYRIRTRPTIADSGTSPNILESRLAFALSPRTNTRVLWHDHIECDALNDPTLRSLGVAQHDDIPRRRRLPPIRPPIHKHPLALAIRRLHARAINNEPREAATPRAGQQQTRLPPRRSSPQQRAALVSIRPRLTLTPRANELTNTNL